MASPLRINAMREMHVKIAAVCIPKRYVVFDNGLVLPILGFLDGDREPMDDGWEAQYYEFGTDETGYGIADFDAYEMPSWKDH